MVQQNYYFKKNYEIDSGSREALPHPVSMPEMSHTDITQY